MYQRSAAPSLLAILTLLFMLSSFLEAEAQGSHEDWPQLIKKTPWLWPAGKGTTEPPSFSVVAAAQNPAVAMSMDVRCEV